MDSKYDFSTLRDFQESLLTFKVPIPGNQCIATEGYGEIYSHVCGYADLEKQQPLKGDELYFLWSATKPVTVSLALRLFEENRFRMNDPLYEYIPEYRNMYVRKMIDGREEILPASSDILIWQLFNMTAGIDYEVNTPAVHEVRERTGGRCPTVETVRAFAKRPLASEPGAYWCYGLCHDVIGALIEIWSGKKLRDYAKEVLFEPLGMNETSYGYSAEQKDRITAQFSYRYDTETVTRTNNTVNLILGPDYDSGGAGMVSSLKDFSKFAAVMANHGFAENGYRFLMPETVDMLRTNTLTKQEAESFCWEQHKGYGYGYGVRTRLPSPEDDGLDFGWGGAAGAILLMDCDRKMSLVYLQHLLNNPEDHTFTGMRDRFYESVRKQK